MRTVQIDTASGKFQQRVTIGGHTLIADEPVDSGGEDSGPDPHEFLLTALGACTSMTVKMYADRKGWPLRSVHVEVTGQHEAGVFLMDRAISLEGDLDEEQRARLLDIAGKCPVHKTLTGEIRIASKLV